MLVYGLDNETCSSFYFFKNLEIKREINKLDILSFEIPKDHRNIFETECKIKNRQSYTIKNIEPFYDDYKIECKQNIDEWLSFFHKSLNFPYKDIETMIKGIIPSGWSYKINGEIKKYRTITADHKSSWEVLEEIVKKFDVEFRIDNNEKILFISEEIGKDKGVFFSDNFNVVDKDINVESFEFATRIIPEGMNGLKIRQINDGKDYLENKSYSGKTITYYWKDERYTNIKNLKEEAEKKLEVLSRPRISIKLKVKDLSKAIGVYEQEYNVGDYVYLIDKDRKTKERFRILEGTFYPNRPFNNEITLANKPLDLASDVDENIELTKEMWEETRGRFEATENLIKGYLENSKKYTDDSFKTYKSEREQTDSKIYETITESTTYVDPNTGQTQPIVDKQLEIIKTVNGIKISVKNNADNLDKKISKEDILEDKEIQEALKGKDGLPGKKGKDGQDGKPGKDGKTGKIGQNLLRNSNVPVYNKDYKTNEWSLCETPTTSETMTFTAKIKLEKDDKLMLFNSGGMINLDWWTEVSKSEDYQIFTSTFTWKDTYEYNGKTYEQTNPPTLRLYTHSNGNGENLNNNNVSVEWATLTRGDIPAIEWSPCYADVDDAIKAGKEETEEVSKKLIKVESDFKIDSNNIKASVSSLSETTERSFVNLKKDMADADVKVETGIKNYLINNYSTKTQTDEKISQEVGSVKASIGNINQEISRTKSKIEQTNEKIETKVSKDGFSSLVKQEFDSYKVQARNINFDGSYVNVKGSFQTVGGNNDVGIKIDYNDIVFRDYRGNDTNYGSITVTKDVDGNNDMSLNIGHYKTGHAAIRYWVPEEKVWRPYVSFDKWYYTNRESGYPITFYEGVDIKGNLHLPQQVNFDCVRMRTYSDALAIETFDGKAGLVIKSDGSVYVKDAKGSRRLYVRQ